MPTLIFLLFFSFNENYAQTDSVILSYDQYIQQIIEHHPLAKAADLKLQLADAEMRGARGNLDPIISSNWNQKNFDKKLYYRQYQGEVQVPTPLGIDFVGGYENTEGVFLNPENKTDEFGLWNVGVEANLLQGLFVNERRVALQQARIFQNMAKNQQQNLLNELLYAASGAYLEWQKYSAFQVVLAENIAIAETYLNSTKLSFFNGEKTAMDTLEAFIMWQDANNLLQYNNAALTKAVQNLENFLWEEEAPLSLQLNVRPENYLNSFLEINDFELNENGINALPIISEKINKLEMLEVEQRWKREKLKPKLKAKYNPLLATSEDGISPAFSVNDYKWGFDFSVPLLLRSERADVERGIVKIAETSLDIDNKTNELKNKIENSLQQQAIVAQQIALLRQNVEGYRQLLEGENEKFRFGESSVFLLNKRQEKYIDGRLKLIDLNIKLKKVELEYLFYTNGFR